MWSFPACPPRPLRWVSSETRGAMRPQFKGFPSGEGFGPARIAPAPYPSDASLTCGWERKNGEAEMEPSRSARLRNVARPF